MKDYDDIFKQRLEGYEMKLPSMDQQSFWSTKAVRERAAKRRRSLLAAAVGIPAIAAVLMAVIISINLLTQKGSSPDADNVTITEQSDSLTEQVLVSPE